HQHPPTPSPRPPRPRTRTTTASSGHRPAPYSVTAPTPTSRPDNAQPAPAGHPRRQEPSTTPAPSPASQPAAPAWPSPGCEQTFAKESSTPTGGNTQDVNDRTPEKTSPTRPPAPRQLHQRHPGRGSRYPAFRGSTSAVLWLGRGAGFV